MSVRLMAMVFEGGPADLGQHSVMMALADHADDGGVAWPGDELLARKSRLCVRQVIRVRAALEAEGWFSVARRARVVRGGEACYGNLYRLNLAKLAAGAAAARQALQESSGSRRRRGDVVSPDARPNRAGMGVSDARRDTVSPAATTCHGARLEVTPEPFRSDMTLAEVLLAQPDAFCNRQEPPKEPIPPNPPPAGGEDRESGLSEDERDELDEVNAMRARRGLAPLSWEAYAPGRGLQARGTDPPGGMRARRREDRRWRRMERSGAGRAM